MSTNVTEDETAVRALIARFIQAICQKDARTLVACYADDVLGFELGPPLEVTASDLRDAQREQKWFDAWKGPLTSSAKEIRVRVNGSLAIAHCLQNLRGTPVQGAPVDVWFRATAAFEKQGSEWKLFHVHNSFPVAMNDGKAHVDLKPL